MAEMREVLFDRPPVVETVLGVQFAPLPKLTTAILAAFWKELGENWPDITVVPELVPQFETFGDISAWQGGFLRLSQTPLACFQIKNAQGDRMVQIQNGRFHYNWLGQSGQPYPRYESVRPECHDVLERFQKLLAAKEIGTIVPNQWEITYVNHMPRGTVWAEPKDWVSLFRGLPAAFVASDVTKLEGFGGHWHLEIAPRRGRLHIEVQHRFLKPERKQEILQATLTARGPTKEDLDWKQGLNLGHDVIVTTFEAMTSEKAHEYWGRKV